MASTKKLEASNWIIEPGKSAGSLVARNPYAAPYPSKAIVTLLSVPLNDAVNSSATIKPFWHKHTLTLLEYGKLLYSMPLPRAGAATPTSARQTANGSFLLAIGFPVLAPRARGKHIPLKPIAGTVARKPDYRRFRTASAVNSFLYSRPSGRRTIHFPILPNVLPMGTRPVFRTPCEYRTG